MYLERVPTERLRMEKMLAWFGLTFRRYLLNTQADLKRIQRERDEWRLQFEKAQIDLAKLKKSLDETNRQLQELRASPPPPTDGQLAKHLLALSTAIADRIQFLDHIRTSSAEPFCRVADEVERSATVSRKERFTGFREALKNAHVQLSLHIDRLLAAHSDIGTKAFHAEHVDRLLGQSEVEAIKEVLELLEREVSPDEAWQEAVRKRAKEFNHILQTRDRLRQSDMQRRKEDREAAEVAFKKYLLPPLTPFEKFRTLLTHGQRDSFTPH
jgi:hypothetical protein